MSEPFIAEIRIFAGNFAPRGWGFCDGQLLPIAQNTALFSLVGTTYGGDGRITFGLPNMQGRAPMHPGRGPGLTSRRLGQNGGVETVTLTQAQMPQHTHGFVVSAEAADRADPTNRRVGSESTLFAPGPSNVSMSTTALPATGGTQSHNNMQPFLVINFIIALIGIFPPRS